MLLYVACTRVRDDLLITNIKPLSEFLTNRITHLMQYGHYVRTTLEIDATAFRCSRAKPTLPWSRMS